MADRPSANELIAAVRQHLETVLLPTIEDQRLRFQTLVAANVLSIVERELELDEPHTLAEWTRLDALLADPQPPPSTDAERHAALDARNRELCARIAAGAFDAEPQHSALMQHLQRTTMDKLEVANPKFLSRVLGRGPGG
jgi:hypothetical protein